MIEFDPEEIERGNSEKLAVLRAAIREDSGPAEPLDMEAIIAEAHADYRRRKNAAPL